MTPAGLYVHIPFCLKKCDYCDFPSFPVNDLEPSIIDKYLDALSLEIEHVMTHPDRISTIYVGGGTPTAMSNEQICKLGNIICKGVLPARPAGGQYASTTPYASSQRTERNIEFTIECNPGTITKEKLLSMKGIGCNRISMGCQSFDPAELKTLGRAHEVSHISEGFELARETGFNNVNIDLIYGIPGQSTGSWFDSLSQTIELGPEHISAYGLQLEEHTPFYKRYGMNSGSLLPDSDAQHEMYTQAIKYLKQKGYTQYEISSFARPGFECRHNVNYWNNGEYIGVGLSAASHINGKRYVNCRNLGAYINDPCGSFVEELRDANDEISETMFMNLRLLEGIDVESLNQKFGIDILQHFKKQIAELTGLGLLKSTAKNLRLTKKGLLMGNEVFERFV